MLIEFANIFGITKIVVVSMWCYFSSDNPGMPKDISRVNISQTIREIYAKCSEIYALKCIHFNQDYNLFFKSLFALLRET